jgi:hypothetical protein
METLRFLMSKILIAIFILLFLWGSYLILIKFFPNITWSSGSKSSSFFTDGWLPTPVNIHLLNRARTADLSSLVIKNTVSPGTSYVEYTGTGMRIVNGPPNTTTASTSSGVFSPTALYIRSLSIYTNGSIYTGLSFVGEARSTLFANNTFPLYIVDAEGRVVATEQAIGLPDWSFPGWTRFVVKINNVLPVRTPCQMIFRAAPYSQANVQVAIPVICN